MEFFRTNTKIPFMKQRFAAAIFSGILFLASILSLAVYGLNFGLDFTGGIQVEVNFPQAMGANQLRDQLQAHGFSEAIVQAYNSKDLTVRLAQPKDMTQDQLKQKLMAAMPGGSISSLEIIGPEVSQQLKTNGFLAILIALIGTMIYIAMRFDLRFAVGAAVALIHDPIIILGVFAFFQLEFNMIVLTAVLTIIGYSLNDTIVVYDRARENFRRIRKGTPSEIMDLSINETLSRTIMTSGLTMVTVVSLFIFGGQTIHGFSLAMIIGVIVGTYSSIYVAGSMAIAIGLDRTSMMPPSQKQIDAMP